MVGGGGDGAMAAALMRDSSKPGCTLCPPAARLNAAGCRRQHAHAMRMRQQPPSAAQGLAPGAAAALARIAHLHPRVALRLDLRDVGARLADDGAGRHVGHQELDLQAGTQAGTVGRSGRQKWPRSRGAAAASRGHPLCCPRRSWGAVACRQAGGGSPGGSQARGEAPPPPGCVPASRRTVHQACRRSPRRAPLGRRSR